MHQAPLALAEGQWVGHGVEDTEESFLDFQE